MQGRTPAAHPECSARVPPEWEGEAPATVGIGKRALAFPLCVDQREGDPMDLYTFLKRLPKVSLHVHLAGTVQPSTLVALAGKNGVALPAYREPENLYNYPDFSQFIQIFDRVIASVRDRADFHRITYETLQQAAEHGVRHREMFWNPTSHMACGVPYETAVDGIIDGIRDARTDFGIQCFLIADINRMGTPELGLEM